MVGASEVQLKENWGPRIIHWALIWGHIWGLWASLLAQMVKNLPAMRETWVQSLGWEDPLGEGMATHSSVLTWRIPMHRGAWQATGHGVAKRWTGLSEYTQRSTCGLSMGIHRRSYWRPLGHSGAVSEGDLSVSPHGNGGVGRSLALGAHTAKSLSAHHLLDPQLSAWLLMLSCDSQGKGFITLALQKGKRTKKVKCYASYFKLTTNRQGIKHALTPLK